MLQRPPRGTVFRLPSAAVALQRLCDEERYRRDAPPLAATESEADETGSDDIAHPIAVKSLQNGIDKGVNGAAPVDEDSSDIKHWRYGTAGQHGNAAPKGLRLHGQQSRLYRFHCTDPDANQLITEPAAPPTSSTAASQPAPPSEPSPSPPLAPYRPAFAVPAGMVLPQTAKQAALIERTARANSQVEAALRVKQVTNPLFGFLQPDDPLHAFYRHVRFLTSTGLNAYGRDSDDSEAGDDASEPDLPPAPNREATSETNLLADRRRRAAQLLLAEGVTPPKA